MHRSGFVNIIGNPNVGKSTLMNALVGEKLSIVTAKAQTTRHRIMGIVNGEDWQIVYSDTPGILKPNYRLQQNMMNFVDGAIGDADIILYVTDVVETSDKNSEYIEKLRNIDCPVIVVINKIDLPSADIDGFDAQRKIRILTAVATGFIVDDPEKCMWTVKTGGTRDQILKLGHFVTFGI